MTATAAPPAPDRDSRGGFALTSWIRGQMQQFLAFVSLIVIVVFFG